MGRIRLQGRWVTVDAEYVTICDAEALCAREHITPHPNRIVSLDLGRTYEGVHMRDGYTRRRFAVCQSPHFEFIPPATY